MASVDVVAALVKRTGPFVGGRLADITCRTEMPTRSPAFAGTVDTCGTRSCSHVTPPEGCGMITGCSSTRWAQALARTTVASVRNTAHLGCTACLRSYMFITLGAASGLSILDRATWRYAQR